MQVQVEEINDVKRKIHVEVPAERVSAAIDRSFASIQKKATLSGFRKGKAPLAMIKKYYRAAMQDEVMRRLYEETLFPALTDNKLEPVDAPLIEDMSLIEEGTPFKYSALIEVMPKILLKDYKGLAVKKERYAADAAAVDAEIERMRENMAQLLPVEEGVVEAGMVLTVDYSFAVPGHPDEDSSGQDAQVEVGKGTLLPGLEEGLTGMALGETKEIAVTLPDSHGNPELAGSGAVFTVTLKEMKKKELSALDDEFAQQFGEFETLAEMRGKLAEIRETQMKERIENDLKVRIIDALIEQNPLEVPDALVRRQTDFMLENMKNRLKGQNMSLEMMGLDEEGFRARFWPEATQKVKGGLLVMALVEQENIVVADDDLEARYAKIAAGDETLLERVRTFYAAQKNAHNSLIAEIKEDKAIAFLLEHAVISEVDAAELNGAAEQ
ncbi:trigger factor [Trichlorobacter ammonificans]|uniref:Trigger factor n=1 Tax=Trichlorobacter ammonificans TaxID=2916410 RepID=A0ABN8HHE1_9BACT|nr:trigger factor [Trichlorobacter ammonificans]CAH2031010.1 Trigger factor [Trichlorobacter ammonificans]